MFAFMESIESRMEQECRSLNCPYASKYGCTAGEEVEMKLRNNGINTCAITPDGKIAVYYIDIIFCEKWKPTRKYP